MKVVLLPASSEAVGVATHVLNLARLLNDANKLDSVICPAGGWLPDELYRRDIPNDVVKLSFSPLRFVKSSMTLVRYLMGRKSAQVLHVHGRFPLFVAILSGIVLRRLSLVVTVHEFAGTGKSGLFSWKDRLEILVWRHLITKICCVSEALGREVRRRIGVQHTGKVVVIGNWIESSNCQKFARQLVVNREGNSDIKLVAVGRLSIEKGFDVLVEAMRILTLGGMGIRCDIFGSGPERLGIERLVTLYGLQNHVRLLGHCENARKLLPGYTIAVIPSRKESFGIVALEAFDAGIPVIAADVPGLNEVVKDGETGLLFEADSPRDLASRIASLVHNEMLKNRLVDRSKAVLRGYATNTERLLEYEKFYADLIY